MRTRGIIVWFFSRENDRLEIDPTSDVGTGFSDQPALHENSPESTIKAKSFDIKA